MAEKFITLTAVVATIVVLSIFPAGAGDAVEEPPETTTTSDPCPPKYCIDATAREPGVVFPPENFAPPEPDPDVPAAAVAGDEVTASRSAADPAPAARPVTAAPPLTG